MSKADHLQKPNGHSSQNFYPEACRVKPPGKQRGFACHVIMPPDIHHDHSFSQDKKLRSLQGSYYETMKLPVSGERVQKKILTER